MFLHFFQNYFSGYLHNFFLPPFKELISFGFCETKMISCTINPICAVRINKNPLRKGCLAEYLIRIRPRHWRTALIGKYSYNGGSLLN
jgi:hypothetical protein